MSSSSSSFFSEPGYRYQSSRSAKLMYAEVVVSFATAVGLLVLSVIQLLYRSTRRARRMWRAENLIRFYAAYILNKPPGDVSRRIIESGIEINAKKDVKPPHVMLPVIVANDRDARTDCLAMLDEIRGIFKKQYGESARLMSMRCCLSCVEGVLPTAQTEEFLRIYEAILFGQHRVDGVSVPLSNDDIKFLHGFFHNTVLKEIRW